MKHNITLLSAILLFSLGTQAQDKVNYSIVHDNPNQENLGIQFDAFTVEIAQGNEENYQERFPWMGYGLQVNYMNLFNRLYLEGSWRNAYRFSGDLTTRNLELGGTWDLVQKIGGLNP